MIGPGGRGLGRFIRLALAATLAAATLGAILIVVGALSVPVAGWGGAYVFAAGLWTLACAALPAAFLVVAAVLFRAAHGRWYFGARAPELRDEE
jgi:hypothetical protein